MKPKLKKALMAVLIFAAVCFYGYPLFVALAGEIFPVPVHQEISEIRRVSLLDMSGYAPRVLKAFEDDEIAGFMERLMTMKSGRYFNDPPTEHGPLTVNIYYSDGAIDYIGSDICQYITASGEEMSRGWYYIGRDQMIELFQEYVDPGILPDLNK